MPVIADPTRQRGSGVDSRASKRQNLWSSIAKEAAVKETPLKAQHEKLGARMVDFAGWYMPVSYSTIKEEHQRVRTKVGLFDVSHMGRYWISGKDHIKFTDKVITNSRSDMKPGQIRYSLICNGLGGALDDVLVYSGGDEFTFFVVNAGNRDKIWAWFERERKGFNVEINDLSEKYAMIALQGPKSKDVLSKISDLDIKALKYYRFTRATVLGETEVLVSRTGYTGEDGFELIVTAKNVVKFWTDILGVGQSVGIGPAGLGARDTLRLEAGMPLYGHELEESISPLEAGLDWAVRLDKADFVGKAALEDQKKNGLKQKLVGLNVGGKRIPRQGQEVFKDGKPVGKVASGTQGLWVDSVIATAFVPPSLCAVGTKLQVKFREDAYDAIVVPLPFYTRPDKK